MSIATYSLISIPVGVVTNVNDHTLDVPLHVLTDLRFDSGNLPEAEVIDTLDANIVLSHPELLHVALTDASGNRIACEIYPEFADGNERLRALTEYLLGPRTKLGRLFEAIKPEHNEEFDNVSADRYVNVGSLYERTVPLRNYMAFMAMSNQLNRVKAQRPQVLAIDHQIFSRVTSYVMRFIHERVLADRINPDKDLPLWQAVAPMDSDSAVFNVLRSTLWIEKARFIELIKGVPYLRLAGQVDVTVSEDELARRLTTGELNVLLQAAIREPLLASYFGLSTRWRLRIPQDAAKQALRVSLIWPPATGSGAVRVTPSIPTAFTISGMLAAPTSRRANRVHGAFIELNDADNFPRYVAVQVNADIEFAKTFVLQDSNRIDPSHARQKTRDRGPMPITSDPVVKNMPDIADPVNVQTHGANQPTTGGLTIYSPVDDLVVSDPHQRQVYFLEDLWVGCRLDIRDIESGKDFLSIHDQRVEFIPHGGRQAHISGRAEDYFERKHLTQDKFIDTVCAKWTGLGSVQCMPMTATRVHASPIEFEGPLQRCAMQAEGTVPRLVYRGRYMYRLRTVFCGGISISLSDANQAFSQSPITAIERFQQAFTFARAEAFSPGELVANGKSEVPQTDRQSAEQVMVVRDTGGSVELQLTPTPLTLDQARFHGLIGRSSDEFDRLRKVYVVNDVRALFRTSKHSPYLCDPDVSRVRFVAKCVTYNPMEPIRSDNTGDVVCDLVPHWTFADQTVSYGERGWTTFRPISIQAHSTRARSPQLEVTRSWGRTVVNIYIPPGDVVVLTIIPEISREFAKHTAFVADMHKSVSSLTRNSVASEWLDSVAWELLPPIVNTRQVTLINPTQRPLEQPEIRTLHLRRSVDELAARVEGLVRLDAKTTATQHFVAHWEDLEDNVDQPEATLTPKSVQTDGKNVKFEEMTVPGYAAFVRNIEAADLQLTGHHCTENSVLHFSETSNAQAGNPGSPTGVRINFPDTRRRMVTLEAIARSRYKGYFPTTPGKDCEMRSKPMVIDLENCGVPMLPQIARIRPMLAREHKTNLTGGRVRDRFALKVFIHRPWMLTGPDERLAIGCSGEQDHVSDEVRSLSSDWGEDPLERPHLFATRRRPRATDFTSLTPERVGYYDNVVTSPRNTGTSQPHFLGLASYALDYDRNETAWFTTITMRSDFFGWVRLAFYRHQPHSLERRHLSPTPISAYVNITQEELITYSEDRNGWRVEIGPAYDRSVSFDAISVEPVTTSVYRQHEDVLNFDSYEVERARIHYLTIKPGAVYAIRKRRAGVVQASLGTIPPDFGAGAK